jgi:hypothetical protein
MADYKQAQAGATINSVNDANKAFWDAGPRVDRAADAKSMEPVTKKATPERNAEAARLKQHREEYGAGGPQNREPSSKDSATPALDAYDRAVDSTPKTGAEAYQQGNPKEAAETAARNKAALEKAHPAPKRDTNRGPHGHPYRETGDSATPALDAADMTTAERVKVAKVVMGAAMDAEKPESTTKLNPNKYLSRYSENRNGAKNRGAGAEARAEWAEYAEKSNSGSKPKDAERRSPEELAKAQHALNKRVAQEGAMAAKLKSARHEEPLKSSIVGPSGRMITIRDKEVTRKGQVVISHDDIVEAKPVGMDAGPMSSTGAAEAAEVRARKEYTKNQVPNPDMGGRARSKEWHAAHPKGDAAPKFGIGQQRTLHHRVEGVGSAGDPVQVKAVNTSKGTIPGPKGFGGRGAKHFEEHRYEVHHAASGKSGHVYEEDLD